MSVSYWFLFDLILYHPSTAQLQVILPTHNFKFIPENVEELLMNIMNEVLLSAICKTLNLYSLQKDFCDQSIYYQLILWLMYLY